MFLSTTWFYLRLFFHFLSNKDLSLSTPGGADLNPVSYSDFFWLLQFFNISIILFRQIYLITRSNQLQEWGNFRWLFSSYLHELKQLNEECLYSIFLSLHTLCHKSQSDLQWLAQLWNDLPNFIFDDIANEHVFDVVSPEWLKKEFKPNKNNPSVSISFKPRDKLNQIMSNQVFFAEGKTRVHGKNLTELITDATNSIHGSVASSSKPNPGPTSGKLLLCYNHCTNPARLQITGPQLAGFLEGLTVWNTRTATSTYMLFYYKRHLDEK